MYCVAFIDITFVSKANVVTSGHTLTVSMIKFLLGQGRRPGGGFIQERVGIKPFELNIFYLYMDKEAMLKCEDEDLHSLGLK